MTERTTPPAPLKVAILIYPGMTLLDMAGPQALWGFHGETSLVWKERGAVLTDTGVSLIATHAFDDCPRDLDIFCVPGGFGTWDVIGDKAALDFVRQAAEAARYVTSVCTGSIILAAAGLIEGRRAATHWATYEILESLGVKGVRERVVRDGTIITGGGVTAGIDFGLAVLAELRGEDVARQTQLMVEYDPHPPFDAGSPERAGPDTMNAVMAMLQGDVEKKALPAIETLLQAREDAA